MKTLSTTIIASTVLSLGIETSSFTFPQTTSLRRLSTTKIHSDQIDGDTNEISPNALTSLNQATSRRFILQNALIASAAFSISKDANAAIGTLPEFSDTDAIFQSITIDVTDKQQYDDTINFFTNGFEGCKVIRERGESGGGVVKDTVSTFHIRLW